MTETLKTEYRPESVSPPGDTLLDTLEAIGMSQVELGERSGLAEKTISQIINGKARISDSTALILERVLGIPAHFWLARESRYQEFLARKREQEEMKTHAEWARKFPYKKMADEGWVEPVSKAEEKAMCLLRFFGVNDMECWKNVWAAPQAAFRETNRTGKKSEVISAWLRQGELEAQELAVPSFDEAGFKNVIQELRPLTLQAEDPAEFMDEIQRRCAAVGVRFLVVRELPSLGVYGVTRWIGGVPVIQQSMLLKSHDHFWFTFFHEAKHVLQKVKKHIFLEGDRLTEEYAKREDEANRFAGQLLIPSQEYRNFIETGVFTRDSIIGFADAIETHPGIVVGRLQRDKHLEYNSPIQSLKVRYCWSS